MDLCSILPTVFIIVPTFLKTGPFCLCRGSLIGFPVENIRVVMTDGASHAVDSSELAFRLASIYAFRQVFLSSQFLCLHFSQFGGKKKSQTVRTSVLACEKKNIVRKEDKLYKCKKETIILLHPSPKMLILLKPSVFFLQERWFIASSSHYIGLKSQ